MSDGGDKQLRAIITLVADLFTVTATYRQGRRWALSLGYRAEALRSRRLLADRLKLAGYEFELDEHGETVVLVIDPKRRLHIPPLNIVLFLLTLATVYFVPVLLTRGSMEATLAALRAGAGIEFTVALMSILIVHEMGHFVASRRRQIITSWPYFIPAPNIIGTFGAVIKSKSPFWNRRDLIEVGAAGPIAGWVVALLWLIYGLSQSTAGPAEALPASGLAFSLEGESVLIKWLVPVLIGPVREGWFYVFTEAAFAAWVGLLVTAINMLPIGQLDGGHIIYGLLPGRQKTLGWLAMALLLVFGFSSPLWWMFAAFGFIFGVSHPPTLDDGRPVSRIALTMGVLALIILLLSFTPVPFRMPELG